MDRRTFVKVAVTGAGAIAVGTGAYGIAQATVKPRAAIVRSIRYYGAHLVGGPARVGVPYIPIGVEDGSFVGRPAIDLDGERVDTLAWLRFCGRGNAPGLAAPSVTDERLYYADREEYHVITPWFKPKIGQPISPSDFPDEGFGAAFVWRSRDQPEELSIPGLLVKVGRASMRRAIETREPAKALRAAEFDAALDALMWGDFIAVSSVCTHFCCVAGYKEAEKLARPRAAWDNLFCTCHSASFDFRAPVAYEREALPQV